MNLNDENYKTQQIRMIDISRFQRRIWEIEEIHFDEIKKRLKSLLNL